MPPPRHHAPLMLVSFIATLLLATLAGLWIWAGTEGSLAAALRLAGALAPSLVTEQPSGNLRSAGRVSRLVWQQNGLRVEVHDAELRWSPRALLDGMLRIERLAARRIVIDDQRAQSEPSQGPPESIALPLRLHVEQLAVGELRWAGPPPYALSDVQGRLAFDGQHHRLQIDHVRVEDGDYRLRAEISAHAPIHLDAALTGALAAPLAGGAAPLPLQVQATLRGPLTELQARAALRTAAAPVAGATPAPPPWPQWDAADASAAPAAAPDRPARAQPDASAAAVPQADATARITPWGPTPLPQADAQLHAIDLGALWPAAPRTRLSGELHVTPTPTPSGGAGAGWALRADLTNQGAGPWDRRQLPLEQLRADVLWQDGAAQVRTLQARTGGGTLDAAGRWAPASDAAAAANAGGWRIDARIAGVNPAALHSQLAALPVDGTARASGAGRTVDFEAGLQARAGAASTAAQALARDRQPVRLQTAATSGRWESGLLTLNRLQLRTDDAELTGSARVRPATTEGSADLSFSAPGARLLLQGDLRADSGAGTLRADLPDAQRLLAWARRLPGAADALANVAVQGRGTLDARWRGGWRDPAVHAHLQLPQLDWQSAADAATPPLQARDLDLTLEGRLAQAQLDGRARLLQGERQIDLRLSAHGGRSTPQATLAASSWQVDLATLQAGVRDPLLGPGSWQLATSAPVQLKWAPTDGGVLQASVGRLTVDAPAPSSQAVLDWGPVQWRGGELRTTGRITGVPLQWAERLGATQLTEAGITGNVLLNGDWDATLGQTLRLNANLARASGDLTLQATDGQTGIATRVPAGLREARVTLTSQGPVVQLQALWDSAQAGQAQAQWRTELSADRDAAGRTRWSWPEAAPLQGQLQARLPQISAWSALAPPGWRLRGALALQARLAGSRAAPSIVGTLSADDLALRSVVDGFEFTDGRLRARLDGTRVLIDDFTLHGPGAGAAGGTLRASGEAGWIDGRMQARLSTTIEQLQASVRPDRQLTVSGNLQALLDGRQLRTQGRLRADRALIVLPDESTPTLGDDVIVRGPGGKIMAGGQAPGAVARPTSEAGQQAAAHDRRADARKTSPAAPAPLSVDAQVQLDLGEAFKLQGMGIDTRLAGVLTLTASGPLSTPPRLTGAVRTVGGTFRAYGQQLRIERGHIVFNGDPANPTLDIVALRPNYASEQRVGAQVMGTALLPRVRLYSDPVLPDNQTLAWLLLGRSAPASGAEAAMLQSAALALLGGREGRGLAASFGLDELSFSGGEDGVLSGASVKLGKRLSDRLYAAYEHSLSGASGTLLIFYELSRRWTLRAQAGENPAVDLIFRLAFD